jgi:hypothetical protein
MATERTRPAFAWISLGLGLWAPVLTLLSWADVDNSSIGLMRAFDSIFLTPFLAIILGVVWLRARPRSPTSVAYGVAMLGIGLGLLELAFFLFILVTQAVTG